MKKLLLLAFVIVAFYYATACSLKNETTEQRMEIGVAVNYNGETFITYGGGNPYTGLDGVTLTQGDLLPMWREVENKLGLKITDQADRTSSSTSKQFESLLSQGFPYVDVLNGSTGQFATYGVSGNIVNIGQYISVTNPASSKLPNLSQFLKDNPTIYTSIQATNGAIYFAPYFDGLNELEKVIMMNTDWIERLLDSPSGAGATTNITTFGQYLPTQSVPIAGNTKIMVPNASKTDVLVYDKTYTTNVIAAMNTQITTNGGSITGAQLLAILKNHITSTYADAFSKGIYTKLSEVYTTDAAGYDVDELIALMRVVKANPVLATGDNTKQSVTVYTPRSGETSRKRDVTRFMQIWGIRGVESRSDFLYFDKMGDLQDARADQKFMDGITYLNQIYKEGLIQNNYYQGYGGTAKLEWRSNLLRSDSMFMTYDYNATTTAYAIEYQDSGKNITGFEACLPPVNAWNDGDVVSTEHPGVKMFAFSESVRSLKSDAWGIPTLAVQDNPEKLDKILSLIDFFYSEEGNRLICYGPEDWISQTETYMYNDEEIPMISEDALAQINDLSLYSQGDMWIYFRYYVGSTVNIGYVRGLGIEYQNLSQAGINGIEKVNNAIQAGSFKIATTKSSYLETPFYTLVPGVFTLSEANQNMIAIHTKVQSVFSDGSNHENYIVYGWGNGNPSTNSRSIYEGYVSNDFVPYYLAFHRQSWAATVAYLYD